MCILLRQFHFNLFSMNYLYEYYSISKCLNASDRSIRLCRQIPGGSKYEQALLPIYNETVAKYRLWDDAIRNSQAASDNNKLYDKFLDEVLVKVNHRCEEFDTANTGSFTRTTLFPNGNYGDIIRMNIYKEPAKATEMAQKLEQFGTTHELYPLAAEIKTAVTAVENAFKNETDVIKAEGIARTNAELAKLALIRKYNSNYFQAADEGGKAFAEKLFPDLGGNELKDEDPPTETT